MDTMTETTETRRNTEKCFAQTRMERGESDRNILGGIYTEGIYPNVSLAAAGRQALQVAAQPVSGKLEAWFEDAAEILDLWANGFRAPQIAEMSGFHVDAVRRVVIKAKRKNKAPKHNKPGGDRPPRPLPPLRARGAA